MTEEKGKNPRTQLNDLPRPEQELSADEQKRIQGGAKLSRIDNPERPMNAADPSGQLSDSATRKVDESTPTSG